MNKRWISLIFVLILVFVLSGCASKATTSDESNRNKIIYGSVVKAYLKTIQDIASDPAKKNDVIKRDFPNSIHKDSTLLNFWSDRANYLLNYVTGIELIEVKNVIQKEDNKIEVATKERWQIEGKDIIIEPVYIFSKQSVNWKIIEVKADALYKILTDSYSNNIQKKTTGKIDVTAQNASRSAITGHWISDNTIREIKANVDSGQKQDNTISITPWHIYISPSSFIMMDGNKVQRLTYTVEYSKDIEDAPKSVKDSNIANLEFNDGTSCTLVLSLGNKRMAMIRDLIKGKSFNTPYVHAVRINFTYVDDKQNP